MYVLRIACFSSDTVLDNSEVHQPNIGIAQIYALVSPKHRVRQHTCVHPSENNVCKTAASTT